MSEFSFTPSTDSVLSSTPTTLFYQPSARCPPPVARSPVERNGQRPRTPLRLPPPAGLAPPTAHTHHPRMTMELHHRMAAFVDRPHVHRRQAVPSIVPGAAATTTSSSSSASTTPPPSVVSTGTSSSTTGKRPPFTRATGREPRRRPAATGMLRCLRGAGGGAVLGEFFSCPCSWWSTGRLSGYSCPSAPSSGRLLGRVASWGSAVPGSRPWKRLSSAAGERARTRIKCPGRQVAPGETHSGLGNRDWALAEEGAAPGSQDSALTRPVLVVRSLHDTSRRRDDYTRCRIIDFDI